MIDNIGKYLSEVIEAVYGDRLKNFISRNPDDQWFIESDYVIGDKNRPHDVLCYTIYPVFQNDPIRLWREIPSRIPKDLKNTSQIDDQIVAALRDDSRFSFCFVLPKALCFVKRSKVPPMLDRPSTLLSQLCRIAKMRRPTQIL
jgi:hypothetical protein